MIAFDLLKHRYLEYKRNPQFYGSTFAKVMIYLGGAMFAGYLLLFGFLIPKMFGELFPAFEPYHMLGKWMFIILAADVLIRFMYQKTPSSNLKPYFLLPIGKRKLLNLLMLGNVVSLYNAIWLFFIVPFAFMTVTKFYGAGAAFAFVCTFEAFIVINNLLYIIFRILVNRTIFSILLPVVFYGSVIAALFAFDEAVSPLFITLGDAMAANAWLTLTASLVVLAAVWLLAYKVVETTMQQELSSAAKVEKRKSVTDYSFFDRFGEVGAYMKLEMKMVVRNKNCRSQFIMGCAAILLFVVLLYMDLYTTTFMQSFVICYVFSVLGVIMLSGVMSYEGNYIDCLLVRRVSILTLLRAKYYLHCLFALLPMVFVIPLMVDGQQTFGRCLALLLFTCGIIFPLVLQLAVYNKKSAPLNDSVNVKSSSASGIATVITMAALTVPSIILTVLTIFFEPLTVTLVLALTGIAGIGTSDWWLKDIYKRFTARKYANLDGYRATR